jgi:ankyrin repeat protein
VVETDGVYIDDRDSWGQDALMLAAFYHRPDLISVMLDHSKVRRHGSTTRSIAERCFNMILQRGYDARCYRLLYDRYEFSIESLNVRGRTHLMWAAELGYEHMVKELLAIPHSDPSHGYHRGRAVELAMMQGNAGAMKLLLDDDEAGYCDIMSHNALATAAVCTGKLAVVRMLADRDDIDFNHLFPGGLGKTILLLAVGLSAAGDSFEIVKIILGRPEVDVNARDPDGLKSLAHHAAIRGDHEVAKLLLAHEDILPDTQDLAGRTPLRDDVGRGNIEVVRLLVERDDVDVNSRDLDGATPLSVARLLYPDIAELLEKRVPCLN